MCDHHDRQLLREARNPFNSAFTRRAFVGRTVGFASLASTTPSFLLRSANAVTVPSSSAVTSLAGVPEDHVLVVVQLSGGNDGLNTVVPYGSAEYRRLRPALGLGGPQREGGALELDSTLGIGLNPAFSAFKELYDEGLASIVQGVGYPNPNRSHFTSMDIWHTAKPGARGSGWIGRFFDNLCGGVPDDALSSVSIGNKAPLAMVGNESQPVNFETPARFKWSGGELHGALEEPYEEVTRSGEMEGTQEHPHLDFLTRTALDARVSADRIEQAIAVKPLVNYPSGSLARQLRTVSAMIRGGMKTRVFYVSLGGFDTHAGQLGNHARLLGQVGGALNAFQRDLQKQGNSGRVMTMVFSEFGRRVAQNASGGTDHGTAAPMYFVGDAVRPGLLGEHPSLTDLDGGDLKHTVDFRSIYAGVLQNWLGCDPRAILGGNFRPADIVKA